MSNPAALSTTKTPIPSGQHSPKDLDLASILQCHLTPSALHALSVLYPKVFHPN
jgi:hypothetical protein